MSSPVSHGDLFQHGRTGVGLPVPRNGRPPADTPRRDKKDGGLRFCGSLGILAGAASISAMTTAIHTYAVFMKRHVFGGEAKLGGAR